jgi:hypothetical protein
MRRRFVNLFYVCSAAVFIVGAVSWPASYHWSARAQWWRYVTDPARQPVVTRVRTVDVGWAQGRTALDVGGFVEPARGLPRRFNHWAWEWGSPPRSLGDVLTPYDTFNVRVLGFQVRRTAMTTANDSWWGVRLEVPVWAAAAVFALPPLLWWRRRRRRRERGFPVDAVTPVPAR